MELWSRTGGTLLGFESDDHCKNWGQKASKKLWFSMQREPQPCKVQFHDGIRRANGREQVSAYF